MNSSCSACVSVIIPCFEGEQFLEQAVCSALIQQETAEVLIVDDWSTDHSLEIAVGLCKSDPRIRILQTPGGKNQGVSCARNVGIRASSSRFVAFLDADDYFMPNRFGHAVLLLDSVEKADGVYDSAKVVFQDSNGEQRWRTRYSYDIYELRGAHTGYELFCRLVDGTAGYFCTGAIVVRRDLVVKVGMFDESLRLAQDTLLWLKLAAAGNLVPGAIPEPILARRIHASNRFFVSHEEKRMLTRAVFVKLIDWLACDPNYLPHIEVVSKRLSSLVSSSPPAIT